jgi:hypothetical protein
VIFIATKEGKGQQNVFPFSFVAVVGSDIRDVGWIKSGSEIRAKHPDPQHCR